MKKLLSHCRLSILNKEHKNQFVLKFNNAKPNLIIFNPTYSEFLYKRRSQVMQMKKSKKNFFANLFCCTFN